MAAHVEGQQHPIGIYLKIWGLLFVLSTASYLVDYFHFQGYLRWFLIILFMLLKAGLIVAVFMHMLWERLAMVYAILVPTVLLMVLLGSGSNVAERIKPVARVEVAPAQTQREPVKSAVAAPPPTRNGQQIYQTTCVACHDAGIAGAPKLGDRSQWAKHIAKGVDALY